jgi:hypothetical protein
VHHTCTCQPAAPPRDVVALTFTIGSVALEKSSFRSCDRHRPSTLPLWPSMTLRRSYVSKL